MRRFWRRATAHWQLKLLSLVFAVALWAFVASEDRGEVVVTVPVTLTDVPAGMAVRGLGDGMVDVRVTGLRRVLSRLGDRSVRVEVSLRDVRPGEFVARVQPHDVSVPRGIQVIAVTPTRLRATLQQAEPPG